MVLTLRSPLWPIPKDQLRMCARASHGRRDPGPERSRGDSSAPERLFIRGS